MTLHELGWSTSFAHAFASLPRHNCSPARVVRQDRTGFLVRTEQGTLRAVLPGALLHQQTTRPVVGDWVAVENAGPDQQARIHAVLPRKSAFSRKEAGEVTREQVVAANVDTAFLMSGLDGDFNLRRIERYVTQTWSSGAAPVVLLNKADLRPDAEAVRAQVEAAVPGVPVHLIRAQQAEDLGALEPYLRPGETVVFLGSSGVGKSTLVNALLGRDEMKTRAVREADSRGRHTTTHRELFILPGGGIVIDTPGLRELQLWASVEALDAGFADVE
ncbi:MAG TPA: ribosome small subunit-dependent GTPase A, partial [Rhodothermales bacterium]|nr:ribosome small subunit-dependent GTPase A [Rhodothermales bacterium]